MYYYPETPSLETRWLGLLLQAVFCDAVKPRVCISWTVWPLRGINKTAWSAKLILMADLAFPVSCASMCHLLVAQHCPLCLNVCFSPPTAPHPSPPPTLPPPTCSTPIDSIRDIRAIKKPTSNTRGVQIAHKISYITILIGFLYCKFGMAILHD